MSGDNCYRSTSQFAPDGISTIAIPQNTPVFHITHWKAGSQWIYRILSALTPDRIVKAKLGEGQVLLDPIRHDGVYPAVYLTREQMQSITEFAASRRFIVIRDLRDTLVSSYYSILHSHQLMSGLSAAMREKLNDASFDEGMLHLLEKWLPSCAAVQASWINTGEQIFKYEDLLDDDIGAMSRILNDVCALDIDPENLNEVVVAHRFGQWTGGRERGVEDVHSHERKGVAGDWREKLSAQVIDRFDRLYGELTLAAGYPPSRETVFATGVTAPVILKPTPDDVLRGFDAANAMYPSVLPLIHVLAWEFAALRKLPVQGRVLDLNCRDGRFFRSVFPEIEAVDGIEIDPLTAELAIHSNVYKNVWTVPSYDKIEIEAPYDVVLANGVFNNSEDFRDIATAVRAAVRPGGTVICSLITQRFVEWELLPSFLDRIGCNARAEKMRADYAAVHGLDQIFSEEGYVRALLNAGFEIVTKIPILPKHSAQLCVLLDMLWHTQDRDEVKLGVAITAHAAATPGFPRAFRDIVAAASRLDESSDEGARVVLELRRKD